MVVAKPEVSLLPLRQVSPLEQVATSHFPLLSLIPRSRRLNTEGLLVDEELAAKLTSEISVEKELGDYNEIPDNLKEFLETSQFKVGPVGRETDSDGEGHLLTS